MSEAIISSNPYLVQWDHAPHNSRDLIRLFPEDRKQHWEARDTKTGMIESSRDLLAEAVKVGRLETLEVDVFPPPRMFGVFPHPGCLAQYQQDSQT